MTPLETAIRASQLGISTWPPAQDGTKRPDGEWKRAQSHRSNEVEIRAQYRRPRSGVGFVCGKVSGNLECIDFDDRATWAEYQRYAEQAGIAPLLTRVVAGYLEHSPNGAHLLYRCDEIAGNLKLAQRKLDGNKRKALVETRGEGGYVIVAPSHGSVNLKGSYAMQSGGVDSIVEITPDERKALHDLARIFDECASVVESSNTRTTTNDGSRPGDDYATKVEWSEILEPHGWRLAFERNGEQSWIRPGKQYGLSATTNYQGSGLLYVFSTSTCFEPNRGINKFSAYATLNHGGDFAAAASALALEGYGVEAPPFTPSEIAEFIARSKAVIAARELQAAKETESKPPEVTDLLCVPGILGEFMQWVERRSPKYQPVLTLGAGLAACGMILGQRVETWTGLRTNLYAIGVGESGCGKDAARKAIVRWFADAGLSSSLGNRATSGAAFEAAIARNPRRLFLLDEFGHFIERLNDPNAPTHLRQAAEVLMDLYTSSASVFSRTERAEDRSARKGHDPLPDTVAQPCLCLYGTTTPEQFLGALESGQLVNGLAGRLLFFESDRNPPRRDTYENQDTPEALLTWAKGWTSIPTNPTARGNLEKRGIGVNESSRRPLTIGISGAARELFADFEAGIEARMNSERKRGGPAALWVRAWEHAAKLATIRACASMSDDITLESAEWGASLAWALVAALADRTESGVSRSRHEANAKLVESVIRGAGPDGVTRARLLLATRQLSARERDEAVRHAVDSDRAVEIRGPTGKPGRPAVRYVWLGADAPNVCDMKH